MSPSQGFPPVTLNSPPLHQVRKLRPGDAKPGGKVPAFVRTGSAGKNFNASDNKKIQLLPALSHILEKNNEHPLKKAAMKAARKPAGQESRPGKIYFDYYSRPCTLMEERHQKLQEFAGRDHVNPLAREYALQLQCLLKGEEGNFFRVAMESVGEIQKTR